MIKTTTRNETVEELLLENLGHDGETFCCSTLGTSCKFAYPNTLALQAGRYHSECELGLRGLCAATGTNDQVA